MQGLEKLGDFPSVGLINFTPDIAKLRCGIPGSRFGINDADYEEVASIPFRTANVRQGTLAVGCEIEIKKPGGIQIEAIVVEEPRGRLGRKGARWD